MAKPDYSSGFHSETISLINSHVTSLARAESAELVLIDLGPGFPDKALPIAKHCVLLGKKLEYWPVDVSSLFLEVAAKEVSPYAKGVTPINARFEDLPTVLQRYSMGSSRLAMLGLTFMNFKPHYILRILKSIAGPTGRALVATELIDSEASIAQVLERYCLNEARAVAFGPLKQLGISEDDCSYQVTFQNGRVEMSFAVNGLIPHGLESQGFCRGDRVLTAISYRYRSEQFADLMAAHFSSVEIFKSETGKTAIAVCAV